MGIPSQSVSGLMLVLSLLFAFVFVLMQPLTLNNANFFSFMILSFFFLGAGTIATVLAGSAWRQYQAAVAAVLLLVSLYGANALLYPGCQNTGQGYWEHTYPNLNDSLVSLRASGPNRTDYFGGYSWVLDPRGLPATLINVFWYSPSFEISVNTPVDLNGTVYIISNLAGFDYSVGPFFERSIAFKASSPAHVGFDTGYTSVSSWGDCKARLEGHNVVLTLGFDLHANSSVVDLPPLNFTIHPPSYDPYSPSSIRQISLQEFVMGTSFQNNLSLLFLGLCTALNAYIPTEYLARYLGRTLRSRTQERNAGDTA